MRHLLGGAKRRRQPDNRSDRADSGAGVSLSRRAIQGTAFILVSSYLNMIVGLAYGVVLARLLDPVHFGVFGLARFFFSLFELRGKVGLDFAFIHRHPTTDELAATHWVLQMSAAVASLVLVTAVALLLPYLGYAAAPASIIAALAAIGIVEAAGTTARAALEKDLAFNRSTIVVSGALLLSYAVAIALAAAGAGVWALVGQVAVNALVGSLGFWWAYWRHGQRWPGLRHFSGEIARWMLRYGAVMTVGAVATTVLLQFDNFLVGTFVGAAALGFYVQAYKVAQWPTGLVTHIISRASLPTYARLQNDPRRLGKAFELSLSLILMVASPLALALFVTAPDFVRLLYGEKWLPAAPLLRFLIGYSVLRPLLDDTGALFTAIGQPQRITTVLSVQAITLALCATPLTLLWGATGTAIGVGIAFIVGVVLTYSFVARTLIIDLPRLFAPAIAAAVISLGLYIGGMRLVDLSWLPLLWRVLAQGAIIAAGFLVMLFLLDRRALLERVVYVRNVLRGSRVGGEA